MIVRVAILVGVVGCYQRVTERPCHVRCGMNEQTGVADLCPEPLVCRADAN